MMEGGEGDLSYDLTRMRERGTTFSGCFQVSSEGRGEG